jgi:Mrp family chromosome partitioning ATPase
MDQFKQAVDLARGSAPLAPSTPPASRPTLEIGPSTQAAKYKKLSLDPKYLESKRIVAYDKDDPRARSYEVLRTQILHAMDKGGWQFLAVTSPTGGCGKTVTACNLALSIARIADRSVLLVDLDMRKPKVANYLGIKRGSGLLGVLQGDQGLSEAIVQAEVDGNRLLVLPGESTKVSSEWMGSPTMAALLETLKREFRSSLVILDLPPTLAGDDVLSIMPQLQSILVVAEAGGSSLVEIKECMKHLRSKPVVRIVVNKITERESAIPYYEYE